MARDITNLIKKEVFNHVQLGKNWLYALSNGETKFYKNDTQVLCSMIDCGILCINSGSVDDKPFCKSLLKDIKRLMLSHDKVLIASEVEKIEPFMCKYGFKYDTKLRAYRKGV